MYQTKDVLGPQIEGEGKQGTQSALAADFVVLPCKVRYAWAKRTFDLVLSSIALLILFPLICVIALVVKLTSKGPVFYKSERIGYCGKPFMFLKFRSMYPDADRRLAELMEENEKDGPIFKITNDPRITPFGKIMRRYSLDELPQLVHVFLGEMSMVGPRPPLRREVEQYGADELCRLSVKPGLTCYWQIMGRSRLSFEEWMALDRQYIDRMSFWTDLAILVKTPVAVLRGFGAY